ncbi:MAG: hypothetical protein BGO96_10495 [Micrococcales bacterium 73-15]|uniref:DUF6932 family protein n=1 Tax=Salana multivorans TaxID=120377 RepID=UPI000964F428|nr:hypothetical protein [Salana multivorans]OJX93388.1 MAG: hypothetical protein BGO96_10495 [Micrococcales bacterium 73-15]
MAVVAELVEVDGLLTPGVHKLSLDELEQFAAPPFGDSLLRQAVVAGVRAWTLRASVYLGPGRLLVGGGFVSVAEPTDTALVVYLPADTNLPAAAAVEFVALRDIVYGSPGSGGTMRESLPVSGLVDAYLADRIEERSYRAALSVVIGADGFGVDGATKGYIEIEVN